MQTLTGPRFLDDICIFGIIANFKQLCVRDGPQSRQCVGWKLRGAVETPALTVQTKLSSARHWQAATERRSRRECTSR